MKLSICIPIYNFDSRLLVYTLREEIDRDNLDAEIVLIDDASTERMKHKNRELGDISTYIKLEKNVGRAKIRNMFLQYAKGDYLLFLDCDVMIMKWNFLKNYLDLIENEDVSAVSGGFAVDKDNRDLRTIYSMKREIMTLKYRQKNPYKFFTSVNFIVKKSIFEKIHFDEAITQYGYEDYLFAQELKANGVKLAHTDNPVMHMGNDTDEMFIAKIKTASQTLAKLYKIPEYRQKLNGIAVIRAFENVRNWRLRPLVLLAFILFKPAVKRNLLSKKPSLKLLDFYRLSLFIKEMRKK